MKQITIENLPSLKSLYLPINSLKSISLQNLASLRDVTLDISRPLDTLVLDQLFNQLQHVELLTLKGSLFYVKLANLSNLKELSLEIQYIREDYFLELFKNVCKDLTKLSISFTFLTNERIIENLLNELSFPNLCHLSINTLGKIKRLEKKCFEGFPMLQSVNISNDKYKVELDCDVFSNSKQLVKLELKKNGLTSLNKQLFLELINLEYLDLSCNNLCTIEDETFSGLENLKRLDLSNNVLMNLSSRAFFGLGKLRELDLQKNQLRKFDEEIMESFVEIKIIYLSENSIGNKKEISNRYKDSKIIFYF